MQELVQLKARKRERTVGCSDGRMEAIGPGGGGGGIRARRPIGPGIRGVSKGPCAFVLDRDTARRTAIASSIPSRWKQILGRDDTMSEAC